MPRIPMNKTRPLENPYLVIESGGWEYRVLKAYSRDPDAEYARWFCAVRSPFTFGSYDWGDTYISDIVRTHGAVTKVDDEVPMSALPDVAWMQNDVELLRGSH